ASQDAAGVVGELGDAAAFVRSEAVVIPGTGGSRGSEAVADLQPLDRTDGQYGLAQTGVQLVKDRITDAGRTAVDDAFDDAARGILLLHAGLQPPGGLTGCLRIRHVQRVAENFVRVEGAVGHGAYGAGIGGYSDAQL